MLTTTPAFPRDTGATHPASGGRMATGTRKARIPRRPLRLFLLFATIATLGYVLYSWLFGYQRIFRDSLTGQLVQVQVREGPLSALHHFGSLFPEFLRGILPMLVQ